MFFSAKDSGQGRLLAIALIWLFLFGLVGFRLFAKQVLEHSAYAKASQDQSTGSQNQPADRGSIVSSDKDRQIYQLAASEWCYRLSVTPRVVKNKQKLADQLASLLPDTSASQIFTKINNNEVWLPDLAKRLDEATAKKIQSQNLIGVFVSPYLSRIYPDGSTIAPQIIGFVGADGSGKYGVEAYYDDLLRGKSGANKVRRDSLGQLIDVLSSQQPTRGSDLILTIDYNLQFEIEKELEAAIKQYQADSGSIVIMNPNNGAILAIASNPKYDPANYNQVPSDQQRVFLSAAASDLYEPGSVFKPLVMSAAVDQGLVDANTVRTFGGSVTVLGHEIKNALNKTFGTENMSQVLENSDNVAMTWLSGLLGKDRERDYLSKYGFGAKSGVDLIGEAAGSLPDIKNWNELLLANAAFGQGVSVNLVQLVVAYSAIANGGTLVTPHLAGSATDANGKVATFDWPTRGTVIKPETATLLRQWLVNVVGGKEGRRAAVEGLLVGGKTGTAQVPDPKGGYDPNKSIGSFVGMFPADKPQFVMAIRLDNPKTVNFAESSAAPTFGTIATWMASYYGLRP